MEEEKASRSATNTFINQFSALPGESGAVQACLHKGTDSAGEGGGTPPKAQTESCEAARGAGSAGLGLAARGRSAERTSAGKQIESCEAAKGAGSAGLGLAARGRRAERTSAGKAERGSIENRRAVSEIYLEPLFFLVEIQKI